MAQFNILILFRQAFGYIGSPYFPNDTVERVGRASGFDGAEIGEVRDGGKSPFGTNLFMPCKIQSSRRNDPLEFYKLPNAPLIDVVGGKRIVKTAIDGSDGEFKELYSLKDYQVVIRGIVTNDANPEEYPEEEVRKIKAICELKNSLKVVSDLTTMFGIDRISIEDAKFPAVEGAQGWQAYELTCSSDREFDLIVKKKSV